MKSLIPQLCWGEWSKQKRVGYRILSPKALAYYESLKEKGGNVYIDTLSYEEFGVLTELDMRKRFLSLDEKEQREKLHWEEENELQYAPEADEAGGEQDTRPSGSVSGGGQKRQLVGEDTIMNRMAQWQYSKEQKEEFHKMMALGITRQKYLPSSIREQMWRKCGKSGGLTGQSKIMFRRL